MQAMLSSELSFCQAGRRLSDSRRSKNTCHSLTGLVRQSVYSRLAGSAATASRLVRTVSSLEKKESDPERLRRIRTISETLQRLSRGR